MWFFWTLPVLLQRWCSTCPVCVHTLTPRENRVRNILNNSENTIFNEHPVSKKESKHAFDKRKRPRKKFPPLKTWLIPKYFLQLLFISFRYNNLFFFIFFCLGCYLQLLGDSQNDPKKCMMKRSKNQRLKKDHTVYIHNVLGPLFSLDFSMHRNVILY